MNISINIALLIFLLIFNIVCLYRYYFDHKKSLHPFNYVILSTFIIINFNFITLNLNTYIPKIFNNFGLSYDISVKNFLDEDLYNFINLTKLKLGYNNSYCILVVGETKDKKNETPLSLASRITKYKIIYYLSPISYIQDISKSRFLIIINYPHAPLVLNIDKKVYNLNKFDNPFLLLDLRQGKRIL